MTDVVSLDSSEMLVVARHRETCQLTLWRLSLQEKYSMSQGDDDDSNGSIYGLVGLVYIFLLGRKAALDIILIFLESIWK